MICISFSLQVISFDSKHTGEKFLNGSIFVFLFFVVACAVDIWLLHQNRSNMVILITKHGRYEAIFFPRRDSLAENYTRKYFCLNLNDALVRCVLSKVVWRKIMAHQLFSKEDISRAIQLLIQKFCTILSILAHILDEYFEEKTWLLRVRLRLYQWFYLSWLFT